MSDFVSARIAHHSDQHFGDVKIGYKSSNKNQPINETSIHVCSSDEATEIIKAFQKLRSAIKKVESSKRNQND